MNFIINQSFHDVRLDRFVRKKYKEVALTAIFRLIRKGGVRVNGKKKKQDYRLQEGDTVSVTIRTAPSAAVPFISVTAAEKKKIIQSIVYQDDNLLLCNKPPGLVMHRGSSHEYGLVELVQSVTGNHEFSFVNRIDKATSGLVIGAKNQVMARKLSELFRQQAIEKYYLIMVEGNVPQDTFTITSYLKKEEERVTEHRDDHNGAKKAVTSFTVMDRQDGTTLLEARLFTGRTHQLRVQLAERHHPIIGDGKYGRKGAKQMLLFSHRVVIPDFNLEVSLPAPDFFRQNTSQQPAAQPRL